MNKKDFIVQGSYLLLLFLFLDQNMEDEDGHTCDGIVMSQEDMEALDEGQLVDIGEERLSEIECELLKLVKRGKVKLNVKLMRSLKLVKRGKVKLNVKLIRWLRLVKRGKVKLNVKLMRCGMKMMDWKMRTYSMRL